MCLLIAGLSALPANATPPTTYAGPAKLIVPTVRTTLFAAESFRLEVQCQTLFTHMKVIHLSEPVFAGTVTLYHHPLGCGRDFVATNMTRVSPGRSVFSVELPAPLESFQYYVSDGTLVWPPGAPTALQSVAVVSEN